LCFPKGSVIALYGPSASGKTSIATALKKLLPNAHIRHCGRIAKEAMRRNQARTSIEQVYQLVDSETRQLAANCQDLMIVEGRYLDNVLDGLPNVYFIKLIILEEERERRLSSKAFHTNSTCDEIQAIDNYISDSLYPKIKRISKDSLVVSSIASVDVVASEILFALFEKNDDKVE
jgi:energy-coupling factor transporter ATP-binding protein EcfA2